MTGPPGPQARPGAVGGAQVPEGDRRAPVRPFPTAVVMAMSRCAVALHLAGDCPDHAAMLAAVAAPARAAFGNGKVGAAGFLWAWGAGARLALARTDEEAQQVRADFLAQAAGARTDGKRA